MLSRRVNNRLHLLFPSVPQALNNANTAVHRIVDSAAIQILFSLSDLAQYNSLILPARGLSSHQFLTVQCSDIGATYASSQCYDQQY